MLGAAAHAHGRLQAMLSPGGYEQTPAQIPKTVCCTCVAVCVTGCSSRVTQTGPARPTMLSALKCHSTTSWLVYDSPPKVDAWPSAFPLQWKPHLSHYGHNLLPHIRFFFVRAAGRSVLPLPIAVAAGVHGRLRARGALHRKHFG